MAARLMQALLLPAMLGLLSLAAPMQPLPVLPASSADAGILPPAALLPLLAAQQPAPADGLRQVLLVAPPSARLRGGQWQVVLERPAVTLQLQSGQRVLYAWQAPRQVIPRPPAARAVAVILSTAQPPEGLGRQLLDAGHMGAFQAGIAHGISHILLLDGAGDSWVTPRMLSAVRWQGGAASFQILQRVCRMGQEKTGLQD